MIDSLYIAWRYLLFNPARSLTLVACITLVAFLPLSLQLLLDEAERSLRSRSVDTPLLAGAKGSALDLVMNSLYFDDQLPTTVSMGLVERLEQDGLAIPVPLYVRFKTRGFPIVGTTLDYFDFRGLTIGQGRLPALLGECILGSEVATQLGLKAGDHLVSTPENLFDLAGIYPLRMKVVGVLKPSHSEDDRAVFSDLKTTWVIQGLGHGHQDLARTDDPSVILDKSDSNVTANAKLLQYTEINSSNLNAFHFHGSPKAYPLSAVIAYPEDKRSETILRGRYVDSDKYQILVPSEVIDGLLENIFRIKQVLDTVVLIVGLATLLALVLVFTLSIRLRQREMETIFKLGCSRLTMVRLLAAEIAIVVLVSVALGGLLAGATTRFSDVLIRTLIA
ncbi:MAG: hypothetical protein GY703_16610 [Gammaproteobacteria bacterium]|nr:hypothetical protein [Gammaproteobacteria bacterium]